MRIYNVVYKEKCIYTDQPSGEAMIEDITAKNLDHLLYLCHANSWHVVSYQQIA